MFNLSNRFPTDIAIKVLEKDLDFDSIQRKFHESELIQDFAGSCRRMRTKWFFRNEPTPQFGVVLAFSLKNSWKLPEGHSNLEVFLSQLKK